MYNHSCLPLVLGLAQRNAGRGDCQVILDFRLEDEEVDTAADDERHAGDVGGEI
jgi:hypothetical protein